VNHPDIVRDAGSIRRVDLPAGLNHQSRILVIGAGMSGMLAAMRLKQSGYRNITIYEKAGEVGGTWRDNTYPGLRCDVPSHMFTYSFEPNPDYSHRFPAGGEIQDYLLRVAKKHELYRLIRFQHEVESARFETNQWTVMTTNGSAEVFDVVICATGVLHHPKYPDIPGRETYQGQSFHTATWNHSVELKGKRIAVIGTGATAVQVVPELQRIAGHLVVFQRTPHWIFPMPNKSYTEADKDRIRKTPGLAKRLRDRYSLIFRWTFTRAVVGNKLLVAMLKAFCKSHLKRKVPDPELRKKLTPNYECGCKRLIFGKGFYQAIQKPNVSFVTDGIQKMEQHEIVASTGERFPVDIIVYATGFHGHQYMRPMQVVGRDGRTLDEAWADGAVAHRSTSVPGFPNFFLIFGPYSPIGNYSAISVAEVQVDYILQQLELLRAQGAQTIEAKAEVCKQLISRMTTAMKKTVWLAGCNSWYLDDHGKPTMWPWTFERYAGEMARPEPSEFHISKVSKTAVQPALELAVQS
jgi:cation diffusion facilitator CzcD-associated flavoprotein CzcO